MTASSVRTPALDCAYVERGPADGEPVFLVHGFPDDARTWDHIADGLAADGYRAIAPYLRGFGPTRLHSDLPRTGEIAAIARDILECADALGIGRFDYVGHDWGARAGYVLAALAPQRLRTLTTFAVAYGTNVASQRLDAAQSRAYWYQWLFATPRGEAALRDGRGEFCKDLWRMWSPGWRFTDAEYDATAASFENPDFVEVVLHSYRQRWGFVPGDPRYERDRASLEAVPPIGVPTLVLMGADDGATLPQSAERKERYFTGRYDVRVIDGCGHFIQREKRDEALAAVRAHLRRR